MAKCVLLEDERRDLLAVLPAACHVSLNAIVDLLERRMTLATEPEFDEVFSDCELSALPPIGTAYDASMLVDDSMLRMPDVYFEGGGP